MKSISDWVCGDCGLVIDKIIVNTKGYNDRNYNLYENIRAGSIVSNLKADYGLVTEIDSSNRDANGYQINNVMAYRMKRLRWINQTSSSSEIRNLRIAIRELKRLGALLKLPNEVLSTASRYYRKALNEDLIRGRSINSMIAAALYLASRKHNFAIILVDLEEASAEGKKVIARCMRLYMTELNIKPKITKANEMISRLASKLELTSNTEMEARNILRKVRDLKLDMGKSPMSIAAAVIYLATMYTGERRTQQMVTDAALITPVTLRKRFREISSILNFEVDVRRGAASTPVFFNPPKFIGKK